MQIAFPVAGHGTVLGLGGALADHHLGGDVRPAWPLGAGSRHPQRPAGAQTGDQLALERAAALDVERLVDRLVADPHRLIIGEVDRQPVARSAPGSTPSPTADPAGAACSGPSTRTSGPARRVAVGSQRPTPARAGPARSRGAARWRPASLPSGAGRAARPATARSTPDTRAATPESHALRRSSREIVDGDRPSRRAISRTPSPCARQMRDLLALGERQVAARHRRRKSSGRMPPA